HARFRPATLPLGLYFLRVVAAGRGPARACCALLRHFAYPLLRAILAVRNLFDVPAFLLLAANLFVARRFVDLRVAIFLASAGVSMENPFSASGACSFSPAKNRGQVAASLGGSARVRIGSRSFQTQILRAGDAAVPERDDAHGPHAQL